MSKDELRKAIAEFLDDVELRMSHEQLNDLERVLYMVSELGLWLDDVDSVGTAQAIRCWQIIEKLRHDKLPDDLRMLTA